MWTHGAPRLNAEHIIPWIIDFFMEEKDFVAFNDNYKQYPVVFISSNEVYNQLKTSVAVKDVTLRHVALSIPDKYRITKNTKFTKEYDVVLLGRQNPVLLKYFHQYVKTHPQVSYVYRKLDDSHYGEEKFYNYYSVRDGVESFIGDIIEREQFISLTRKGKIGLYATPDIDTNHERAHGYNQVTPRFLEFIASGAHVIARYIPNPDTDYYKLQDFSKPIETYEQFEEAMDYAMTHEVDMAKYADYLAQHYTSVRAKEIEEIMKEL